MLARFIIRSTIARMPAVVVPRIIRPFSSSPQQQQQKPTVPPFQHAAGTRAPAYMNFLDEDHEGAAWGHIMAQALSKGRDAEHKRQLAFLALAFREFDVNRDQVLCKDEVKLALLSLNLPADDPEVKAMMTELDKNKDNVIQLDEWLDHLPRSVIEKLQEHASAARWRKLALGEDDLENL